MATLYLLSLLLIPALLAVPLIHWGRRWFGDGALGAAAFGLLGVGTLFSLEHYIALPNSLLAAFGFALAAWAVWLLRQHLWAYPAKATWIALMVAATYLLAWRWRTPSIAPQIERLTDIVFITNFMSGDLLPPTDRWLPPFKFDFYYPLQFYGAALFGRTLHLETGYLYNLCLSLLLTVMAILIWKLAYRETRHAIFSAVIAIALMVGGTGSAPIVAYGVATDASVSPVLRPDTAVGRDVRFVGGGGKSSGMAMSSADPAKRDGKPLELPLEPPGHSGFVGDYHPPLIGFTILFMLLSLLYLLERPDISALHRRSALLTLGALPVFAVAGNAWIFPLAALLVAAWTGWKLLLPPEGLTRRQLLAGVAVGGTAALALLSPFLKGLALRQLATPIKRVTADLHSPLWPWLLQWWPLLGLIALTLAMARPRSLPFFLALMTVLMLGMSELIYIDDSAGLENERANTAMKWWGWIWAFGLLGLGTGLIQLRRRWVTVAVIALLSPTLINVYWQASILLRAPNADSGDFSGSYYYTLDQQHRELLSFLRSAKDGVVVESIAGPAYTDTGALSLFGNKPLYLGWPNHEYTWRGALEEVWRREALVQRFYAGQMADPGVWLDSQDIRYAIWSLRDCAQRGGDGVRKLNERLSERYWFYLSGYSGQCPVGVWVRR